MHQTSRPYWVHSEPLDSGAVEPRPSYGPCPSRCTRNWRRAVEAYEAAVEKWIGAGCIGDEPKPVETRPWFGDPVLCLKCAAVTRGSLRDLPRAYDALNSAKFLTRSASADEERRGRSDVPPSPSPGADQQDEICRTIAAWEDDLRHHLQHATAADTGEGRADLVASVEYLNRNWQAMVEREECAAEFAEDVDRLFRTSVAMVKNKPVRRTLDTRCPSCDVKALIQEEGTPGRPWYVECSSRLGGCSRLYSETEYDFFIRLIEDGHVPADTAVSS